MLILALPAAVLVFFMTGGCFSIKAVVAQVERHVIRTADQIDQPNLRADIIKAMENVQIRQRAREPVTPGILEGGSRGGTTSRQTNWYEESFRQTRAGFGTVGQHRHRHRHGARSRQHGTEGAYNGTASARARTRPGRPTFLNCPHCILREEAKRFRIEAIKNQILSKLRLKAIPNITGLILPKIPPLRSYLDNHPNPNGGMLGDDPNILPQEDVSGLETDDYHATTVKVFNFAHPPPRALGVNDSRAIYFTFQPQVVNSKIVRSHLWVYTLPTAVAHHQDLYLLVYKLLPPEIPGAPVAKVRIGTKKFTPLRSTGTWVHLDVKRTIQSWVRNPTTNYGLMVEAVDNLGKILPVTQPDDDEEKAYLPFIQVRIQERGQNRRRRMLGLECDETSMEERCCRYPLVVDFTQFGWDWIIAPKTYRANYCSGECPYVFQQRYLHTHVVQQANPMGFAGPCCTPLKLSQVSMLYFDDSQNIVYGVLPGMKVERCGCT
ncbi:growth/differentiation factor 8 [Lingula anatina]|uniref:Growth/differentiation factor 8 n=1 Tax=Lingula anatina TaxID=7574 RepID=A0A1S3IB85_LINAN|nr:growth/differentiation factor 8 [Lingula anatina]|eukprot:XP_013394669.1 growth/differentiation factor 8 [Lingula anatina]